MGLNVSNRQPTTCVDAILEAALSQAGRPDLFRPVQREALMAALCARFEHCFDTFQVRHVRNPIALRRLRSRRASSTPFQVRNVFAAWGPSLA